MRAPICMKQNTNDSMSKNKRLFNSLLYTKYAPLLRGEQLEQLSSGHVLFTKGGEESIGGVGFLVNKNIKDRIVQFEGESSRVASLTLKVNSRYQLQVIQVYAPTSSHSDEEVEDLYEEITRTMERDKSHFKIIMGDFNAKVGQHQHSDGAAVGKYGLGDRNERGTRLVQFAISKNLKIAHFLQKEKEQEVDISGGSRISG